ncbi:hypothetical protein NP493_975g04077 [Ridgeia piscesae]|uniref:BTB domain-containing protein n=1 Tax=Ridgeia piscesae TaxID=27915 RepID=A0AAD9NKV5_RIDPI|nr:hypothetical protein NP493_975g04077 [Ridgeia piscesae]
MEGCYPDFTVVDEMASVTLVIEGHRLYVHREVLAAWSPVFRAMFVQDFKEKSMAEIELPGKKVEDFVQLLHCIYPPIQEITDSNVFHLLPLTEEYQISEVKKRCEEYLLTRPGSMELLITAQTYGLMSVLEKCIEFARKKTLPELQKDAFFKSIHPENVIQILMMRCGDLEDKLEQSRKMVTERDVRLYGCINEFASGYGSFCTECKSRRINDTCFNCLKMFRDKVKTKCDEVRQIRNQMPLLL